VILVVFEAIDRHPIHFLFARPNLVTHVHTCPNDFTDAAPNVLILCGLSGSSQSNYIRNIMVYLQKNGYRAICLNARGTGDTILKTPVSFNGARTNDCREAIHHIQYKYPNAPIFAIGYSLGANILTKYLAEEGNQSRITSAVCICVPFDFTACARLFKKTIFQAYDRILARAMIGYVLKHKAIFESDKRLDIYRISKCRYIDEFDQEFTIKVFDYKSSEEYYKDASTHSLIPKICTPTLFINAINDPLIDANALPYQLCSANPYTILCTTDTGGHIGWPEGLKVRNISWTDKVCLEYINANLGFT